MVGCVGAEVSGSDCGCKVEAWAVELVSCTVWAAGDEKVLKGSVVGAALPSVVEMCGVEALLCTVGADERLSVVAGSGDMKAVNLRQYID